MGIDAEMLVKTRQKLSEAEVKGLAYDIAEAFGAKNFWILRPSTDQPDNSQRAIELVKEFYQDGPTIYPQPDETFLKINIYSRYYGRGYERGDLPLIIMVAEWLERRISDANILYGGDSSGVLMAPFGPKQREELFSYFASRGGGEYRNTSFGEERFRQDCNFCERPMIQYGMGGGGLYEAYRCPGCGDKKATRDGGLTWSTDTEGY